VMLRGDEGGWKEAEGARKVIGFVDQKMAMELLSRGTGKRKTVTRADATISEKCKCLKICIVRCRWSTAWCCRGRRKKLCNLGMCGGLGGGEGKNTQLFFRK